MGMRRLTSPRSVVIDEFDVMGVAIVPNRIGGEAEHGNILKSVRHLALRAIFSRFLRQTRDGGRRGHWQKFQRFAPLVNVCSNWRLIASRLVALQGCLHGFRRAIDNTQVGARRTFRLARPLLPMAQGVDRETEAARKLFLGHIQPGADGFHVDCRGYMDAIGARGPPFLPRSPPPAGGPGGYCRPRRSLVSPTECFDQSHRQLPEIVTVLLAEVSLLVLCVGG